MNNKDKIVRPIVDLSWMWHCSKAENILDYNKLIEDEKLAKSLNKAVESGFRIAMRKMEDMDIIQMNDIDRNPENSDQTKWNEKLKN